MRGRKPKPAEEHARNGDPGKRGRNQTTLVAGRGRPTQPAGLNARAKTAWKQLVEVMSESGVLDKADALAVEHAARTVGRLREVSAAIDREGLTVEGQKSATVAHPLLATERSLLAELRQSFDALGIGPSGRARLGIAAKTRRSMGEEMSSRVGDSPRGLRAIEGGKA
jgi:P27 family predicted phage terminase small subunit